MKYATPGPGRNHGESNTPLWDVWSAMLQRCFNRNDYAWKYYGGKGVKVCEAWRTYLNFKSWAVANGYRRGLTIDRKDSNGDYEPSNCRWITREENSRRASAVHFLTAYGVTKTVGQWMKDRRCKAPKESCLRMRVARGWGHKEAITTGNLLPRRLTPAN